VSRADSLKAARRDALREHLRNSTSEPDAASLSRSYGLPQPEVETLIRSAKYA